jgi:hypothetical protein
MPLCHSRRCLLVVWLEGATFLSNARRSAATLRSSAPSARLTAVVRVPPFLHVVAFSRRRAVARLVAPAGVPFPEPFRPPLRPLSDQKYRSGETDRHDGEPCHGTFSQFIPLYNTSLYYTNQLWRLMVAGRDRFARCGTSFLHSVGACTGERMFDRRCRQVAQGLPFFQVAGGLCRTGAPLHGVKHARNIWLGRLDSNQGMAESKSA